VFQVLGDDGRHRATDLLINQELRTLDVTRHKEKLVINMSQITIVEIQGELVVDSRIIAEQLGVKHKSFLGTIRSQQSLIEEHFGVLRFETAKPSEGTLGGRPETFVWLTEDQATFVMSLSRNTPEVIRCKIGLVKAFSAQKKQLENPIDRKLFNELADRIAKLETQPVAALPPTVPEMTRAAQVKELVINYVNRMGCEYESAWKLLYTKFGLLYRWKPTPKSKLSKIAQIEAAGKIEELYQLALKLFI
jgi:phage regulator Rha-like protein